MGGFGGTQRSTEEKEDVHFVESKCLRFNLVSTSLAVRFQATGGNDFNPVFLIHKIVIIQVLSLFFSPNLLILLSHLSE